MNVVAGLAPANPKLKKYNTNRLKNTYLGLPLLIPTHGKFIRRGKPCYYKIGIAFPTIIF
jgi:hypothetical protein